MQLGTFIEKIGFRQKNIAYIAELSALTLSKEYVLFAVQGIRDLFWLPIEQYQKDGRIVRGLQRGANSFTTSTAMAALELTTRIVHAIQASLHRHLFLSANYAVLRQAF